MNERELDHGVLVERIQTSKDNIYYLHRCQYKVGKYGKCNYHETTRQCIDDGEKYKCPLGCKSLVGKVLPIKKPTYEEKIASMGEGFLKILALSVYNSSLHMLGEALNELEDKELEVAFHELESLFDKKIVELLESECK